MIENASEATALVAKRMQQDASESVHRVLQSITAAALEGKTQVQMAGCFANAAPGLRERGFTATIYSSGDEKMLNVSWPPPGGGE